VPLKISAGGELNSSEEIKTNTSLGVNSNTYYNYTTETDDHRL